MNQKRLLLIGRGLLIFIICLSFLICGNSATIYAEAGLADSFESTGTVSSCTLKTAAGTFTAVYVPENALPVYTEGDFQELSRNVYAETESPAAAESSAGSELADQEEKKNNGYESVSETSSEEVSLSDGESGNDAESVIATLSAGERALRTSESGLYKSQFSGSILEFLYNALEQCTLTPSNNGVAFNYYYSDGEDYTSVKTLYRANWFSVLYGYKNDNPELFYWAKNACSGGGLTDHGTYCSGTVSYLIADEFYADDYQDTAESVLDSAISLVNRKASRYTQLKTIYNWLCAYAEYDRDALNASSDSEEFFMAHSELGILINQKGVCESYAKVFKLLCKRLDIPCLIVTSGTYDGDPYSHGWDYVKMEDGSWYMIDPTFGDTGSNASDNYFLVSNEPYIDQYHTPDNLFAYPETASSDYVLEEEQTDNRTLLDAPVLTSLKLTTTGLKLSWNEVIRDASESNSSETDASKTDAPETVDYEEILYRIYRIYDGGWVMLDETSQTAWTDESVESGQTYKYSVEAVLADGTRISKMDETGLTARYIAAPSNIKTTNTASGVKITWAASQGAEKYRVFRRVPGGGWSVLADTTSLSYTDAKAASGATYLYTVRCINSKASAYTSAYLNGTKIMYLKEPVTTVSNVSGGITVKWTAVSGASGYNVYRRPAGGGWKLLTVIKSGRTVTYKDSTAASGNGYYYTVRAINGGYISSYNSGSGSIYLTAPKISLSYYNVKSIRKGITITWSKTTGASGYYLYRKVYGGSWVKIATIKSGSSVKFSDITAKKGKKYSYAIQAYCGSYKSVFTYSGYLKR